jgi:hypothetical protein
MSVLYPLCRFGVIVVGEKGAIHKCQQLIIEEIPGLIAGPQT